MLKQLLKNYPQVASLEKREFTPNSTMPDKMKLKLLKSWARGGCKDLFCRLNGVDKDEYDVVVADIIREAEQTGEPVTVSRTTEVSEGTILLYGYYSEKFNEYAAIRVLGFSRSIKKKYSTALEEVSGVILGRKPKNAEREFFKKVSDEPIWHSPKTGKTMNKLDEASMYPTELREDKMTADKVTAVLYCKDSFREFIHYSGDDLHSPGTYEFRFEFLSEIESTHGVA